jgi:cytochrome c nitrite reductase small subunit
VKAPPLFIGVLVGAFGGLGLTTFRYAEGLSYFSTDPRACANCHIMREQYGSWQQASHHGNATCVQCHLPHSFVPKMLAKAEHGWNHSKAFTLQNFHEPIRIGARSAAVLQNNCVSCHQGLIGELTHGGGRSSETITCVHCHRDAGHGARN